LREELPALSEQLSYRDARDVWQKAKVTKDGKSISVLRSGYKELEPLGAGVGLYFRTLKALAGFFCVVSVAGAGPRTRPSYSTRAHSCFGLYPCTLVPRTVPVHTRRGSICLFRAPSPSLPVHTRRLLICLLRLKVYPYTLQ